MCYGHISNKQDDVLLWRIRLGDSDGQWMQLDCGEQRQLDNHHDEYACDRHRQDPILSGEQQRDMSSRDDNDRKLYTHGVAVRLSGIMSLKPKQWSVDVGSE